MYRWQGYFALLVRWDDMPYSVLHRANGMGFINDGFLRTSPGCFLQMIQIVKAPPFDIELSVKRIRSMSRLLLALAAAWYPWSKACHDKGDLSEG